MIKPSLDADKANLLCQLPLFLITAQDGAGRLWATALLGTPGFLSVGSYPSLLRVSKAAPLHQGARSAGGAPFSVGIRGLLAQGRCRRHLPPVRGAAGAGFWALSCWDLGHGVHV